MEHGGSKYHADALVAINLGVRGSYESPRGVYEGLLVVELLVELSDQGHPGSVCSSSLLSMLSLLSIAVSELWMSL